MTWVAEPRSHLGWDACGSCGRPVLVAEDQVGRGRCGSCPPLERPPVDVSVNPAPAPSGPVALEVEATAPHPAPLVPYRAATEVEIPSAARTVRKLAEAQGWEVKATYALGWAIDTKGRTKALTHSTALRMQRGGHRLVAVWIVKEEAEGLLKLKQRGVAEIPPPAAGWKFDLAYGWSKVSPLHSLGAEALKVELGWVKPKPKPRKVVAPVSTIEGVA